MLKEGPIFKSKKKRKERAEEINEPPINSIRVGIRLKLWRLFKNTILGGVVVAGTVGGGKGAPILFDYKWGNDPQEKVDKIDEKDPSNRKENEEKKEEDSKSNNPEELGKNLLDKVINWTVDKIDRAEDFYRYIERTFKENLYESFLHYGREASRYVGMLMGFLATVSMLYVILKSKESLKPNLKDKQDETIRQVELIKENLNALIREFREEQKKGEVSPEMYEKVEKTVPPMVEQVDKIEKEKLQLSPPNEENIVDLSNLGKEEPEKELVEVKKEETPKKPGLRRNPDRQ